MAIKTFKDIIDNQGYRINAQDRKIFEDSDIQSFFGISSNDLIEFVLYDINDNQLPQKNFGLVRYIPLTSENIKDYFLIAEGTIFQKYKFPSEYFVDVNRLIKEAGYDAGIFKTQITLLNKRLGSEKEFDKVWIQEISPSRTEIRVLTHKKGLELYPEIAQKYNAFVNDLDFRDDTIRYTFEIIEKINPSVIDDYLKSKYSDRWVIKFVEEYKLKNLDLFSTQIYNKFIEASINEFTGRISDVNDLNFGKPKPYKESITLSRNDIRKILETIVVNVINKYLPIPNVNYGSKTIDKVESIDEVQKITKSKTQDLVVDIAIPETKIAVVKTAEIPKEEIIKEAVIKEKTKQLINLGLDIKPDDIIEPDGFPIRQPVVETETIIETPRRPLGRGRIDIRRNSFDDRLGAGFFDELIRNQPME